MSLLLAQVFEGCPPYVISRPARPRFAKSTSPWTNRETILFSRASEDSTYYPPITKIESRTSQIDQDGRRYRLETPYTKLSRIAGDREFLGYRSPEGHSWRYSLEQLSILHEKGLIYESSNGSLRLKRFLDELPPHELPLEWDDLPKSCPKEEQILGTVWHGDQEPLALMHRLIEMSSDPRDLVLAPNAASGALAVAAMQLCRRWIGGVSHESELKHCLAMLDKHKVKSDGEVRHVSRQDLEEASRYSSSDSGHPPPCQDSCRLTVIIECEEGEGERR